ncbi:membrane-anchored ubiquitin-fold protein 3-like isoform X1 [Musa acuminata AAA Group]|uniref:membrane-anchored ubiquitin-fold protein 3-like isoform X1 n=1 Tax=Musa acuminata AAA Group TaxID=214697 RepID=UPI0031D2D8E9
MPEEDLLELRFRLYDGSDIGPIRYSSSSTIAMLKERIVSEWPRVLASCVDLVVLLKEGAPNLVRLSCMLHANQELFGYHVHLTREDKQIIPKIANDVKLISAGKILENSRTISQCKPTFGELPGGIITMHVVVQPSSAKSKTEKKVDELPKKAACYCSIL